MKIFINKNKLILIFIVIFGCKHIVFSQISTIDNTSNVTQNYDSILQIYPIRTLYFDSGSHSLRISDIENLNRIVQLLKNYPEIKLEIKGHTDNQEAQNLSTLRSQTVYQWFLNQGIEKQRIVYKGMGATYPVTSNYTPENRQLNRRIELSIIK
jgi:outer membrane protein OmpA-like peptidoglycan-associated protein